jgi:tRNA threonylcarbamoyladenosine biosynthesis protein TsaE
MSLVRTVAGLAGTEKLGRQLAACLPRQMTVGLVGTLGAGKTFFVQSVAAELGVDREEVVSPTFVLCHHYQGRVPIFHLDSYRIKDPEEFVALGIEEYFEADGITFIEWSDRIVGLLPSDYLRIQIDAISEVNRQFNFTASGPKSAEILNCLAASTVD